MQWLFRKIGKAVRLLVTRPDECWHCLRPYVLPAKNGPIDMEGVRFVIDLKLDPVMRSMAFGVYQTQVIALMRRFLREGDTFIDVGANVGYLSAVALGLVGRSGEVHAFEPVPVYFERLQRLRADNSGYRLYCNATALGEAAGTASIACSQPGNIGWNTMVPGFMPTETIQDETVVPVTTLDDYLGHTFAGKAAPKLRLVKIDVEGFELLVLRGFQRFLRVSEALPILIVEIAPTAYSRLGASLSDLATLMADMKYVALSADRLRPLDITTLTQTTDAVFVPESYDLGSGV